MTGWMAQTVVEVTGWMAQAVVEVTGWMAQAVVEVTGTMATVALVGRSSIVRVVEVTGIMTRHRTNREKVGEKEVDHPHPLATWPPCAVFQLTGRGSLDDLS